MNIKDELSKVSRGQILIKYNSHKVKAIYEDEQLVELLCESGIPRLVAPMLDFIRDEKGGFDKLIAHDEWNVGVETLGINCENNTILAHYNNCLIVIGEDMRINMIDYDNHEIRYVNKDIVTFFKCIICFNLFMMEVMERNPDCEYIEDCITDEELEEIERRLSDIDENAMEENSLWSEAVDQLVD